MAKESDSDAIKYTFALGESLNVLSEATESAGKSFGDFAASSNKGWTVLARILSGSGLWRLQARIRAAGNIFELYFKNQEKMIKAQLNAAEANIKVDNSLRDLGISLTEVRNATVLTDKMIAESIAAKDGRFKKGMKEVLELEVLQLQKKLQKTKLTEKL